MSALAEEIARSRECPFFLHKVEADLSSLPSRIPFVDGAKSDSLTQDESFELRKERLPGVDANAFPDLNNGWTLYRHFASSGNEKGRTSPCYHFTLQSMAEIDFAALSL